MWQTAGLYFVERFAEGFGFTAGVPLIAALLVRSSPLASARAAFIATVVFYAFYIAITWLVPNRDLFVESVVVFAVAFPIMVYVFGTCVSALRRNLRKADDPT